MHARIIFFAHPRDLVLIQTLCRHTSRFLVIWLTFMPFTLWCGGCVLSFVMRNVLQGHLSPYVCAHSACFVCCHRKPYGWGTIPASVAIAFLLLGIEEIGVQIEEP